LAGLIDALADTFGGRNNIQKTMKGLERNRSPVRLEVEQTEVSFYTVLSLRPKVVVLARPPDLEDGVLKKGGFVRFIVPDASKNVVRMQVIAPNYKRERGDAVIVCQIPEEFAEKSKRGADRFNTSRFKNLKLIVPQVERDFRIVDMSYTGCKVFVEEFEEWETLKSGTGMRFTKIAIGEKAEIELDMLTPRVINPPTIAFTWEVHHGESAKWLAHMINSLHRAEMGRLKIKERAAGIPLRPPG